MTVGGTPRGVDGLRVLAEELQGWQVLPSVIFPRNVEDFLDGPRRVCTLAGVPLDRAGELLEHFAAHERYALVNIDTCPGFGRDDAAVATLAHIGAAGVLSTRLATIQKARQVGLVTVQVVFMTDRSAVQKGIAAVRSAEPHLVQLMPAPVLERLTSAQREALGRFFVSGFVEDAADVAGWRELGALGASSSSPALWGLRR